MIKKIFFTLLLIVPVYISYAGNDLPDKIKVYIDCRNTHCDTRFILSEINVVDFLLDRTGADVQVLITSQPTATGSNYQLIFYGFNRFPDSSDSLTFNVDGNATDFEVRDILIRYLKAGLAPFIAKTDQINNMHIDMKSDYFEGDSARLRTEKKDPWKLWVFRIGGRARIEADKVYKTVSLNTNLSARHTTDKLKTMFYLGGGTENSSYEYDTDDGPLNVQVKNENYNVGHMLVKSIDNHWCYGYEINFENNTFSNYKEKTVFHPQVEYSFFPVRDVNNKYIAFRYGVGIQSNTYYDTTIYNKTKELLLRQSAKLTIEFNQKWGSISTGLNYRSYLNDWSMNNFQLHGYSDVRIAGGLSVYWYFSGELAHDQVYLSSEGATEQEVLTRRKQLESGYNVFSSIGITYRFGSNLNNFVNPRFENRYF